MDMVCWPPVEPEGEAGGGTTDAEPEAPLEVATEEEVLQATVPDDIFSQETVPGDLPTLASQPAHLEAGASEEEDVFGAPLPAKHVRTPAAASKPVVPPVIAKPPAAQPPATMKDKVKQAGVTRPFSKVTSTTGDPGSAQRKKAPTAAENNQHMLSVLTSMQQNMNAMATRMSSLENAPRPASAERLLQTERGLYPSLPGISLHSTADGPPPPPPPTRGGLQHQPLVTETERAALLQERLKTPLQTVPRPGKAKFPPAFSKARTMPAASSADAVIEETVAEFGTVEEDGGDELRQALVTMTKNQSLLTALLMEKESASSSMASGSGGADAVSLKGPALLMRRRRNFVEDPDKGWHALNCRFRELMNVEEIGGMEQPWSADQYGKEHVPWDNHKLAKRGYFIMSKLHHALRHDRVSLARGIVAQGLKFFERIPLDHGGQEAATLLLPWEDIQGYDGRAPAIHLQDPFHGLIEPEEAALGMRYLTDIHNFNKIKSERSKGTGKGKKEGKEKDGADGSSGRPNGQAPKR